MIAVERPSAPGADLRFKEAIALESSSWEIGGELDGTTNAEDDCEKEAASSSACASSSALLNYILNYTILYFIYTLTSFDVEGSF
ncbi:hypothetical protein OUZ56_011563 [Daphnia magna]|uniref:Uncharacterized protein n=1 Tax=Daphnia magna TaxID=35525 RepID=A0ABQ9Z0N9_9CRUS|nr:hypothetical protein OUZ56_011563 [Daphnia magna]